MSMCPGQEFSNFLMFLYNLKWHASETFYCYMNDFHVYNSTLSHKNDTNKSPLHVWFLCSFSSGDDKLIWSICGHFLSSLVASKTCVLFGVKCIGSGGQTGLSLNARIPDLFTGSLSKQLSITRPASFTYRMRTIITTTHHAVVRTELM